MKASALFLLGIKLSFVLSFGNNPTPSNTCEIRSSLSALPPMYRSVRKILPRPTPHWVGDGFQVYPVFANMAFTDEISPLLMFDYAEPKHFPPREGPPRGVGQHPHRGFETVTIAFQGEAEHHDSTGKTGVIGPGDVQWMTAGRGVIHQEYHSKSFTKQGGTFEMCQLWVNLPQQHKMTPPNYQAILHQDIPEVHLPLNNKEPDRAPVATARIIAGELGTTPGAARTFSPVQLWDVSLPHSDSEVEFPFPAHHNCIIFIRRGKVEILSGDINNNGPVTSTTLGPQEVALMHRDGSEQVRLRVQAPDSSILILGGEPLNEPIAARGPFVMNTEQEIMEAFADYRSGKMGQ